MLKFKDMTKKQKQDMLKRVLQVVIGTIILAFGQAIFIEQCALVIGGVASIGNIINHFINTPYTVRVTVVVLNVVCFLIGLIFFGKKFSAKTLISTIVYIIAYPLVSYLMQTDIAAFLRMPFDGNLDSYTTLLLAGIFGGMVSGVGIAFCFLGGGSTGGVDVFAILFAKVTRTKVPLWMFIIDAVVVFLGYIILGKGNVIYFLICVLSALSNSLTTEMILSKQNNSYVVSIVSEKWEEINSFILEELDRGSTLIDIVGGYTMKSHRMIQAAISRDQYSLLLSKISEIDKDAFVTINSAHEVNGEGFDALPSSTRKKRGN